MAQVTKSELDCQDQALGLIFDWAAKRTGNLASVTVADFRSLASVIGHTIYEAQYGVVLPVNGGSDAKR